MFVRDWAGLGLWRSIKQCSCYSKSCDAVVSWLRDALWQQDSKERFRKIIIISYNILDFLLSKASDQRYWVQYLKKVISFSHCQIWCRQSLKRWPLFSPLRHLIKTALFPQTEHWTAWKAKRSLFRLETFAIMHFFPAIFRYNFLGLLSGLDKFYFLFLNTSDACSGRVFEIIILSKEWIFLKSIYFKGHQSKQKHKGSLLLVQSS